MLELQEENQVLWDLGVCDFCSLRVLPEAEACSIAHFGFPLKDSLFKKHFLGWDGNSAGEDLPCIHKPWTWSQPHNVTINPHRLTYLNPLFKTVSLSTPSTFGLCFVVYTKPLLQLDATLYILLMSSLLILNIYQPTSYVERVNAQMVNYSLCTQLAFITPSHASSPVPSPCICTLNHT